MISRKFEFIIYLWRLRTRQLQTVRKSQDCHVVSLSQGQKWRNGGRRDTGSKGILSK